MENYQSGQQNSYNSRKKRTLFQRLGVLAAVLFVGLLVGGMALALNINRQGGAQKQGHNPSQAQTGSGGTPIPTPVHPLTGGKCSIDTTRPAPQKSQVSVPGVYIFGMYEPSDNVLYRYDPQTKKVIWSRKFCGQFESNGTIEHNGILYLAGVDVTHESGSGMVSYLYALNETDGSALWGIQFPTKVVPFQKGDPNYGSSPKDLGMIEMPTIANGMIYVVQRSGIVYAFDEKTGSQLWTFNSGRDAWASSAQGQGGGSIVDPSSVQVVNGIAYFTIVDRVFALDPTNGRQIWTHSFNSTLNIGSAATIDSGTLYLTAYEPHYGIMGSQNTRVYAFDAQLGTQKWKGSIMSDSIGSPIAYQGHLAVASNDTWYGLDPASGAVVSQKKVAINGGWGAMLVNGTVYGLTENASGNILTALNVDGSVKWSVPAQGKYSIIDDIQGGVIYISGRGTGIYAYSATSGAFLWHYGGYHMQYDAVSLATVVP